MDLRVDPAHVGERVQGDPRLVVQAKLAAVHRFADRALELDPGDRAAPRFLVEQLEPRAAALLGAVHRGIGLPDHGFRGDRRVGHHRDPDAHRDRQLDAVDVDRRARGLADAVGDQHDLALGRQVLEQERELVPAEPSDGVHRTQQRAEPLSERGQQPVADGVAAGVVDLLEVVEVEEHDPQLGPGAPGALERDPEPIEEQGTVGQAGELVVEGLVREVRLRALALDRVGERAPQQRRCKLGLHQAVLGAGLYRLERERLVVAVGQQHDRRPGRGQPHVLEQVDRLLVRVGRDVEQHAAGRKVDERLRGRSVPLGVGQHLHTTPRRVQQFVDPPRSREIGGHQQHPYGAGVHRIPLQ